MSFLRLINWEGLAGIAVALTLTVMLTVQKLETVHWKKQSASFEQLYQQEQAAFATTVVNARAAADQARAADKANADRVAAEQHTINERTLNDFEARIAAARIDAQRLRVEPQAATNPGPRGSASVPRVSAAANSAPQAPGQDRLPPSDALTATEQAIQLDELIKWVEAQAKVDNNRSTAAIPSS